jgi:hypothetical protein
VKKLILFLAILLSGNICLGAELVPLSSIKRMELRSFDPSNQSQEVRDGRNNFLKVFYEKRSDKSYSRCAFLIEYSEDKKIVRFTNFSEKSYEEAQSLLGVRKKYKEKYLLAITDMENNTFYANDMEDWQQPEELLDMESAMVWMEGDKIVFEDSDGSSEIKLYNPVSIEKMKSALSERTPLVINLVEQGASRVPFKVLGYANGAYIHWKGWKPEFVPDCIGMPHDCTKMRAPIELTIDLDEDKEYFPMYQRNKYVSRLLLLSICAGFSYWLKIKMGL